MWLSKEKTKFLRKSLVKSRILFGVSVLLVFTLSVSFILVFSKGFLFSKFFSWFSLFLKFILLLLIIKLLLLSLLVISSASVSDSNFSLFLNLSIYSVSILVFFLYPLVAILFLVILSLAIFPNS